mmetsp:Transcript_60183/g.119374  ORF Transcript_60183/g.119374 Transcript_60183/m.119374 type:complete len:250 (+) Transcript_60183:215-964(+)
MGLRVRRTRLLLLSVLFCVRARATTWKRRGGSSTVKHTRRSARPCSLAQRKVVAFAWLRALVIDMLHAILMGRCLLLLLLRALLLLRWPSRCCAADRSLSCRRCRHDRLRGIHRVNDWHVNDIGGRFAALSPLAARRLDGDLGAVAASRFDDLAIPAAKALGFRLVVDLNGHVHPARYRRLDSLPDENCGQRRDNVISYPVEAEAGGHVEREPANHQRQELEDRLRLLLSGIVRLWSEDGRRHVLGDDE